MVPSHSPQLVAVPDLRAAPGGSIRRRPPERRGPELRLSGLDRRLGTEVATVTTEPAQPEPSTTAHVSGDCGADDEHGTASDGIVGDTAGTVLRQVLARSAVGFLRSDVGDDSDVDPPPGSARQSLADIARIHQSRVAMRRIRSNLRTFRLLVDPAWGTVLRAELAWYGDRLGPARDLHVLRDQLVVNGPLVIDDGGMEAIVTAVDDAIDVAARAVAGDRASARRARLVDYMAVVRDDPPLTDKARQPADEVLSLLLRRAWHDVRGAARTARKDKTDEHLHQLRIRLKGLRYGCETVALVEGRPARKTARSVERLQTRLGDLRDTCASIVWLEDLAERRPELAGDAQRLVVVQKASADVTRKGWKSDLKEIERRWRRWQD